MRNFVHDHLSAQQPKRIVLKWRAAQIAAKLAAGARLPPPEVMRNSGGRRTPEKKALLERLAKNRENPPG